MKKLLFPIIVIVLFLTNFSFSQISAKQPEIFAPGIVSTVFQETSASFTPDGKTVYFTRSDIQFADNTILESHFQNNRWSQPEVASFSGIWRDSEPNVSPDGKKLFYVSNRPISGDKPLTDPFNGRITPGANIWYVEKKGNDWGEPVHLEGAINAVPRVFNPSITKSCVLYFLPFCPMVVGKIRFIVQSQLMEFMVRQSFYLSVIPNGIIWIQALILKNDLWFSRQTVQARWQIQTTFLLSFRKMENGANPSV